MTGPRIAMGCLLVGVATAAPAQQTPPGWRWVLDRPAENVLTDTIPPGGWRIQEMIPGMHVTTGPGVLLVAPAESANGRFAVAADLLLFPNSSNQGYGVAFGARDLDGAQRSWNAFLVSGDGRYALVRYEQGAATHVLPWATHDAVKPKSASVITNRVTVAVEPDSIRFTVNGAQVAAVPRESVEADGAFGLRFEENVNLHVTNVDVTRRLLKRRR